MKTWGRKATYYGIINQSNLIENKGLLNKNERNPDTKKLTLSQEVYGLWKSTVKDKELPRVVTQLRSHSIHNRRYTIDKGGRRNSANSNVEFFVNGQRSFGIIQDLFKCPEFPNQVWFVIKQFGELNGSEKRKDPYHEFPLLNTCLVAKQLDEILVISDSQIVGHIALLENPASTFGIARPTCSIVSLGNLVCL